MLSQKHRIGALRLYKSLIPLDNLQILYDTITLSTFNYSRPCIEQLFDKFKNLS